MAVRQTDVQRLHQVGSEVADLLHSSFGAIKDGYPLCTFLMDSEPPMIKDRAFGVYDYRELVDMDARPLKTSPYPNNPCFRALHRIRYIFSGREAANQFYYDLVPIAKTI